MWKIFGKKTPPFTVGVCKECGCLELTVDREVTAPFSKKFAQATVRESNERGIYQILVDVSQVSSSTSAYDSHQMAEKHLKKMGLNPDARVAILSGPDDSSHDVVATAMNSAGYTCRIFRSREHAVEWLCGVDNQAN